MPACTILAYHIIDEAQSDGEAPYCTKPADFEAQLDHLVSEGYSVIDLDRLLACMDGRQPWPDRPVALTFDDGTHDFFTTAAPAMAARGLPATMFMVAGLAGQASEWVRSHSTPRRLVDGDELRQLVGTGMTIGSHTDTHVRLGRSDAATVRRELHDSRARLEDVLGGPVDHFAYPYGSLGAASRDAVEEAGYRSGGSREPGRNGASTDRFVLRRVGVGGPLSLRQFALKVRFGLEETAPKRVARATVKRALQRVGAMPAPGRG